MLKSTSIVRKLANDLMVQSNTAAFSTGMVSSKGALLGLTAPLSLASALLPQITLSFMTLLFPSKLVSDSARTVVSSRCSRWLLGTYWYHSHLSTQYCDGLRGAIVIYDDHDPHKDLYDVDDGELISCEHSRLSLIHRQRALSLP